MPGYDAQAWRRSLRKGRQRGCMVYIPAEELERLGIDPTGPAPLYRTAGRQGGQTVMVTLRKPEVKA